MRLPCGSALIAVALATASAAGAQPRAAGAAAGPARVTVLYDAFGSRSSAMTKDWGYAALVEYGGARILFDTGNDAATFARNVRAAGVDLRTLDFVVVSHRHGDHTSGLNHLLRVNPRVKIYAPREAYGVFGGSLPESFYRRADSLPREERYFEGEPPPIIRHGTPWPGAAFVFVDSLTTVAPGVTLVPTVSDVAGTRELRELSLSIQTPDGQVLVVGCSHAGIERVVAAAVPVDSAVRLIVGGLHLASAPDSVVERTALALRDRWRVQGVAPGHCTGEPGFAIFRRTFGPGFVYAGLGTRIPIAGVGRGGAPARPG